MNRHPWLVSLAVTAVTVAVSLWLWFGPWLWHGIPWLVVGALPFLVGLFARRIPLLFAQLPVLIPYLVEGNVETRPLMGGIGAAWIAAGAGILIQRLLRGGAPR